MATGLTIGRVADATGIAATTLRYYEQIGLVPAPVRVGASAATTTQCWLDSK